MPTPTPSPIPWFTPTPIPPPVATAPFSFGGAEYVLAESIVQGYQTASQYGVIEVFIVGLLILLVLGGVYSIIRRVKSL